MGKSLQGGRLVSNSRIFVDSGGNIGIGSTQPTSKFDITGDVKITGISTLSNVTVGGATTELVVNGDARVTGILTVGTASLTLNGTTGAITGGSLTNAQVAAISSEISDTAVDVFIYDTSKDSDGGAWRKRTTHTRWYNETLGTATRGSRKEFPAVAVIVVTAATTRKLYIYDGDDPDLPMWMVIDTTDGQWPQTESSSLYALNGIIALGSSSDSQPLYETRNRLDLYYFVSDKIESSGAGTGGNYYGTVEGLVNRRTHATNRGSTAGNSVYSLVNLRVNDVAMTVLPNAPIDSATGLPVPTIAVATEGGTSIIKDDGTVADLTGFNPVQTIHIDESSVIGSTISGVNDYIFKTHIPPSDESYNAGIIAGSKNYYMNSISGSTPLLRDIDVACTEYDSKNETTYRGGTTGLDIIAPGQAISNNSSKVAVAYATTSYNTGYMVGDIKGAFLSDTTAESLTANTNLATNATQFDTGRLASETYDNGDTSWQMVDNSGNANGYLNLRLNGLTIGQSYIISVTFDNNAALDAGYNHRIDHNDSSQTDFTHWNKTNASSETLTGLFTARSQNGEEFVFYANAITLNVSNFIVRAVDDEDRSINNKGLQVFGTVTKSAVATGAELVAYSGFSASNYLQQPYNSDLDFGTGDLSISFWYKMTSTASPECILHRGDGGSGTWGSGNIIQIEMDGVHLEFQIAGPSFSPLTQVQVPIAQSATGQWQHFVGVRSGGVMSVYIDSVKYGNVASTQNATNTTAKTWIGERPNSSRPASSTSMTLFRMSASAPSAEQVKKMYEDEKVLFQENAACTLYGSSDAVTALAYDDSTNLLYAGTSAGRSDFQGLRRINNTTTAVTTAMSASNGLVVEQ